MGSRVYDVSTARSLLVSLGSRV